MHIFNLHISVYVISITNRFFSSLKFLIFFFEGSTPHYVVTHFPEIRVLCKIRIFAR